MRWLVQLLVLSIICPVLPAQEQPQADAPIITTATLKFAEKFTRSHKKIKENFGFPFFGTAPRSRIVSTDKGSYNLLCVMALPSVDLTKLDNPFTDFTIVFGDLLIVTRLDEDPDWVSGKRKATIERNATLNGKPIAAQRIKLAWDAEDLSVSIKGQYGASDDVSAGSTVFARRYLDSSGNVAGVADLFVTFGPSGHTFQTDFTTLLVPFAGTIKSTPFKDSGSKNLKMGFVAATTK